MKKYTTLLFCFMVVQCWGQQNKTRAWKWGAYAGLETQILGIEPLDGKEPEETAVAPGRNQPGFSLGLVMQKKLWRGLHIQPGISFSRNHNPVIFRPEPAQKFAFSDLEVPIHFIVSKRKNELLPVSARLLFGSRVGWDFASKPDKRLNFIRSRWALDLGLGIEARIGELIICPEVIYSYGLNNLHDFVGTEYDFLVGRMARDKLALRITILMD